MNQPLEKQKPISLKVLDGQTEFAENELQKLSEILDKLSKPIFYVALVAAVIFFGSRFYNDAQTKSRKDAAQQFMLVDASFKEYQASVDSLSKLTGDKKTEETKRVEDQKKRLLEQVKALKDAAQPYKDAASIYEYELGVTKDIQIENKDSIFGQVAQELKRN